MFYQRLFIIVFGYIVVMLALSLRFLPDTIVSIVFIVSGGFGFCSAFSFVCGMLCPRINRKGSTIYHTGHEVHDLNSQHSLGIIWGYIFGLIPPVLSLFGMFVVPRHYSMYNLTTQTADQCELDDLSITAKPANATQSSLPDLGISILSYFLALVTR